MADMRRDGPLNKVLFCGSRDWPPLDDDQIRNRIAKLRSDDVVIHGGAPGADHWAGFWAKRRGLSVRVFRADWDKHGKAAGPIRNRQMLDQGPRLVVAFMTSKESRGTLDTVNEARRRGLPVEIHERAS